MKISSKITKICLLVSLALIIVGGVFFGVFGFNRTVKHSEGYEVIIKTNIDFGDNTEVIEDVANDVFDRCSFDYLIYNYDSVTVYTFKDKVSDDVLADLESKLNAAINTDNSNVISISVEQFATKSIDGQRLLPVFLSALGALVILGVYLMIRQRFAAAFAVMCSAIFEGVFAVALTALTRAIVVPAYYAILMGSIALTIIGAVLFTGKARYATTKYGALEGKKPCEVSAALQCGNFKINVILLAIIAVFAIAFIAFGPALVRWAGLTVVISAISVAFTNVIVTPALWTLFAGMGGKDKFAYKPAESTSKD